ncbi:MAG: GWxTD domain-containing protein [Bacteroidia bacterium]|nr:GWxTD domain-containing protein [Bacteroidia bacterium]
MHCISQAIYFHHALFRLPDGKPYLETYMAVDGKYFPYDKKDNNQFQVSVSFKVLLKKENDPEILLNQYSLKSPFFSDTNKIPVFLDVQRYALTPGNQRIIIQLLDHKTKTVLQEHPIALNVPSKTEKIFFSDIEWVERYQKSQNTSSPFFKSGHEVFPYLVNYFPEKTNTLCFYTEAYCFSNLNSTLTVQCRIMDADDNVPVKGYLKKTPWNDITKPLPLLGQFEISALPSGNYYLEFRVLNNNDSVLASALHFFQRKNFFGKKSQAITASGMTIEKYVRQIKNFDTLYMHIECLYPISSEIEKERQFNHLKTKDTSNMRNYLIHFWTKKSADTINPYVLCKNYMQQVYEANALFRCGKQKGYNTEQGRVYLQYGKPSQVAAMYNEANTFPYEIWHYYRSFDQTEQRYVTNRRFVFVNNNIADHCFRLVHSDMRGEINNERWRYDVMKRFNNGIQNDSNIPVESQNTQMNDLFQTPR